MKRIRSFFMGILCGALVGGAVAFLLAPASGKSFQDQIGDTLNRLNQEVSKAAMEKRQQMETELSRLRASKFEIRVNCLAGDNDLKKEK